MFKKIAKKVRKKKSSYSALANYNVNYQPFKMAGYSAGEDTSTKLAMNKNQVKNISDDFYHELYSFKNLPIRYLLLMIFVVPTLSIFAIYYLFQENKNDGFTVISLISGLLAYLVFVKCREINEESILKNQVEIQSREFSTIDEARAYWIRDRIGYKNSFFEFAGKLCQWKDYKEKYNKRSKINWFNYIYDPQSKPRILALFIALISLFTIVTMNAFEIEPFSVLAAFFGLKHILIEETWLVLFLIFIVCFLLWQIIFISHILNRYIIYLVDSLNKNNFSELKFSILINFLLDHSDF